MSHPWYVNKQCKGCKRRESIWTNSFEGKWILKLLYCMTSRQDMLFPCLMLTAYFIYSPLYLGASKLKTFCPWKIRSQDEVWVSMKQGCRRLSMRWVRKIFVSALSDDGPQLLSSTEHKVRHCLGAAPSFRGHSCSGLIALALSVKMLAVELCAACLMSWSCSSV